MTYHLPKAALIVQHQEYEFFASPDHRLRSFPSNYELLLADVILLTGSDALTEWIGTAFYLLFLGLTAMIVRRWWGEGVQVVATVLACASAPLLLLHSGADKNDLMTALFCVAAIYWSARWCSERRAASAALAIVCGMMAVGTKMIAGSIVIGVAPFGVAALVRHPPRARHFAHAVVFAIVAILLLGGWVFVINATAPAGASQSVAGVPTAQYGAWSNLIELPYEILRVSFGLPAHRPWPKHDLFSSHFGAIFGLALIALPFCVMRYRSTRERTVASLAALIAFVTLLPIVQEGRELYASVLRYAMFVLPFVLAWTVAPVVRELAQRRPIYAHGALALLSITFVAQAADIAINDTFAPIEYVRWAAAHRGTRESSLVRTRAAFIADQLAAPHDTIAVFGGSDVWIYPAFGEHLTRRVVHLPYDATIADIPDDARWIVIDYPPALGSPPTGAQLRFFDELARDPRFALRWRHRGQNQAVFQRVAK